MKTTIAFVALFLTGCSHLPKDAYIRDVTITTPWGSSKIGAAATGKAATNLTAAERAELLKHIP